MARHARRIGVQAGGSSGGGEWDLRPIYRSLAAAYGWTYSAIDEHTLAEVNDLFEGWNDSPPTNLLVRAIVEGLGGGRKPVFVQDQAQISDRDLTELASQAGKALPIQRGPDPGLPKAAPVFDLDLMRKKNLAYIIKAGKSKPKGKPLSG